MEKDRDAIFVLRPRTKPLRSYREIIEFALRFSEMPLNLLSRGDLINLREELALILHWQGNREERVNQEELAYLQRAVAWLLYTVVRTFHQPSNAPGESLNEKWPGDPARRPLIGCVETDGEKVLLCSLPLQSTKKVIFRAIGKERQLRVEAEREESLQLLLLHALWNVGADWLRQCLSCARLFLAEHGLQAYCSRKCMQREGTRRFRAAQQERQQKPQRKNAERRPQRQEKK